MRRMEFDVAVIGGGTAGTFAAISAARNGARTILIEKNSRLGGTITAANVDFPGLFFAWGRQIIDGPCWEAIRRTEELGGAVIPPITYKPERHWHEQIRVNQLVYTYVLNQMCREAGVHVLTNAMLSYAEEDDHKVRILITDKSGILECNAKIAIDATGDANLTRMLKYDCAKSEIQQPATLWNHLSGYDIEKVDLEEVTAGWEKHAFSQSMSTAKMINGLREHKLDVHISCKDADLSEGRSELEFRAVETLVEIYKFLRRNKGLENVTVDFIAQETGVRESNRIVGEAEVLVEDYLNGFFYPDSICYAFYPVDLHVMEGIQQSFLSDGIVPKIPYRALIPKGARRLICAGRCVSSDTYANSALRVQAPCMAMGQAAGCAAALAAEEDIHISKVSYKGLCASLEALGAIVPKKEDEALLQPSAE